MSEEKISDIAQALKIIVDYAKGKGQLPRLDKFIVFWVGINALADLFNINVGDIIDIDKLVKEYSVNAPVYEPPLWIKVVENMSKLNTKTEVITQVAKRKVLE